MGSKAVDVDACEWLSAVLAVLDLDAEFDPEAGDVLVEPGAMEALDLEVLDLEVLTVLLFASVLEESALLLRLLEAAGAKRAFLDSSARGRCLCTPHIRESLYTVLAIKAVLDAS